MEAYMEGRMAQRDWANGKSHNADNPYCWEDERYSEFERGLMDEYEESLNND